MVGDGHEDLSAKGRGAAVPEEALFPCEVEEWHGIAVALAAIDADADGEAVGEGGFFGVAGGAGDGAIAGEPGVVEELAAEIDAFCDEGVVAGEIGDGEGTADGQGEGSEVVREIDGFEGRAGGDGGSCGGDALDVEGGGQIGLEGSGEGIAVARVGGGAITGEGERARGVEEGGDVEVNEDSGVFVEIEVGAEGDGGAVRVAGEVPCEALRFGG